MSSSRPNNEAEIQLRAMLGQMPQHNPAGLGRRIAAGLVAAGAARDPSYLDAAERVRDPKYYEDMAAWKEKLDPLKALATTEASIRSTDRLIDSDRARAETARKNAETAASKVRGEQETAAKKLELEQDKLDLIKWAQQNPDMTPFTDDGGKLVFVDPKNPTRQVKTDFLAKNLTPMQLASIGHDNRMAEIAKRTEGAVEVKKTASPDSDKERWGQPQDNFDSDTGKYIGKIQYSNKGNSRVVESGPNVGPKAPPKSTTEDEKQKALLARATKVLAENQDLAGYIIIGTGTGPKGNGIPVGEFKLPRTGIFGSSVFFDSAKVKLAHQLVYGDTEADPDNQSTTTDTTVKLPPNKSAPTRDSAPTPGKPKLKDKKVFTSGPLKGKTATYVRNDDGTEGWLPDK
jgi:hypothetical protein